MLGEALFLGSIFLTLNASDGSAEFLTPSASVQIPQAFPVLPALRRGRKLGSWHTIRRKRLKRVGTENASARDDLSPAIAKVLLLRGDSQELSEVLLPSP